MRQTRRQFLTRSVLAAGALTPLCAQIRALAVVNSGLADAFSDDFSLGTAVSASTLTTQDAKMMRLIAHEFSAITAENSMKWESLQPTLGKFDWREADAFVRFAQDNNLLMIGHTLVWHSQIPNNVFFKPNGEPVTKSELLMRMETHINTVMSRYKGVIPAWDVVNEAIDQGTWRNSHWLKIIGSDYFQHAFRFARHANPSAHLIYNDYNMHHINKQRFLIEQIKRCRQQGVIVDGVGMECHATLDDGPTIDEIENAILTFAEAGLTVHISELDIDVLPATWNYEGAEIDVNFKYSEAINPYPDELPATVAEKLATRYQDLFRLFVKHRDKIARVSVWGTTDNESWKNDWPVAGRTNHPLLFDRQGQRKQAYYAISDLKDR